MTFYNIYVDLSFFFAREQNFDGLKNVWFPLTTPSSGHISLVLNEGSEGVKAEMQTSPQPPLCSCLEFLMNTPTAQIISPK
jgi:hypothetical protein